MQYSLMTMAILGSLLFAGCGRQPRTIRQSTIIRQGIQDVDKHAKEIDKANQPIGKDHPTP